MLSFDPLPHLGEKALRAEDPDHRAEGKQLDEKLCLVGRVIIEMCIRDRDYVDLYIYHMWDYETPLYDIMDGLNRIVKAGKARYIGISNCFAYQLAKANALAEKEGFSKFVSIQGHYNLIFREEEREMARLCAEDNIAMTPYLSLIHISSWRCLRRRRADTRGL